MTYTIMTFNLRTQSDPNVSGDGINAFMNRKGFVKERLAEIQPDVIGFQEITPLMYNYLYDMLPEYTIVGGGRSADFGGEAVCIAFKKEKFYLYDCDTFWLSATPDVPGSRYTGDQSDCPRVCTCATLKPRDGAPFRVYNVHTDHKGYVARIQASTQVLQRISRDNERLALPFFVTGDFNALPDDLCIQTMLGYAATPIVDLSAASGGTFHNYGKKENHKIDYIFASADAQLQKLDVFTDVRDGVYLSDHYPVMATIVLASEKENH